MAFRIEYKRGRETVMVVSCPKSLEDAIKDSAAGLKRYDADKAIVHDMDGHGRHDTVVQQED